jgi:transcriptional regulator with XRE-family HTH domain
MQEVVPKSAKDALRALGRRIQELRREAGYTQERMAERVEMLAPNYARIEQGRQNVTVDTLVRVARALDVPIIELFRMPRSTQAKIGRPKGT